MHVPCLHLSRYAAQVRNNHRTKRDAALRLQVGRPGRPAPPALPAPPPQVDPVLEVSDLDDDFFAIVDD